MNWREGGWRDETGGIKASIYARVRAPKFVKLAVELVSPTRIRLEANIF